MPEDVSVGVEIMVEVVAHEAVDGDRRAEPVFSRHAHGLAQLSSQAEILRRSDAAHDGPRGSPRSCQESQSHKSPRALEISLAHFHRRDCRKKRFFLTTLSS